MASVNKADVYRKAAEIIVRDGQYKGDYTPRGNTPEAIKNTEYPVCAIGACVRAEWELYGEFSGYEDVEDDADPRVDGYTPYAYKLPNPIDEGSDRRLGEPRWIWSVNDSLKSTAEDIAELFRQRAQTLENL